MDNLTSKIRETFGWEVQRGYEEKKTDINKIYLTNTNNVKGLEFPFVICVTGGVKNEFQYRNKLYTMLTRSFIITYLLVQDSLRVEDFQQFYDEINADGCIKNIVVPTPEEEKLIRQNLIDASKERQMSWDEFMQQIFEELEISDKGKQSQLKKAILNSPIDKFEKEKVFRLISTLNEMS